MEAFHESMGRRGFLSHLFHNLIYTLGFGAIIALFFALARGHFVILGVAVLHQELYRHSPKLSAGPPANGELRR